MPKTYFIPVIQDSISLIVGEYPDKGYVRGPLCESLAEARQEMNLKRQQSYPIELHGADGLTSERVPNVEMIYEVKLPDASAKTIDNNRFSNNPIRPIEIPIDLGVTRIINVYSTINGNVLHKPKEFEEKLLAGQRPKHAELTVSLMKQVSAIYDLMSYAQQKSQINLSKQNKELLHQFNPNYSASIYTLFSSDALINQDPATLSTTERALQLMQQQMRTNNHSIFCVYGNNLAQLFNEKMEVARQASMARLTLDDVIKAANYAAETMNAALGLPNVITAGDSLKYALLTDKPKKAWPASEEHAKIMVKQFQLYGARIPESEFLRILHDYTEMAQKIDLQPDKNNIMQALLRTCAATSKNAQVIEEISELLKETAVQPVDNVTDPEHSPVPMMVYGYFEGFMQKSYNITCGPQYLETFQNVLKESEGHSEMRRIGDAIDTTIQALSHQGAVFSNVPTGMDIAQKFTQAHLQSGMYEPVCFAWVPDDIRPAAEEIFVQQSTCRDATLAMTYALAASLAKCDKMHDSASIMRDISTVMNEVTMTAHRAGAYPENISSIMNEAFQQESNNDVADDFEDRN